MTTPDRRQDAIGSVVSSVLEVEPEALTDESSPETVESWDSLTHLTLVMALESEFDLSLTPEEALDMKTLGLIRAILREHGVGAEAAADRDRGMEP